MKTLETDCLIIGSGAAGSAYALEASKKGLDCILLSARESSESNSWHAQGGIILPVEGDKTLLKQDILKASGQTAAPETIDQFIDLGTEVMNQVIMELDPFDRLENGELDLTTEAAHSTPRIVHSKDSTGMALIEAIWKKIDGQVTTMTNKIAVDLLTLAHSSESGTDKYQPSTCVGAYVLDTETGEVSAILAQRTVLATGGLGQLFLNTTNSKDAYGHGISMAYRVGARIMDMEFIQFHPTVYKQFLITESLRGEGANFVNSRGEPFMDSEHPDGSLAPRDIVSRAVFFEMMKTGESQVYLDTGAVENIQERFPNIYNHCLSTGLNIAKEPIPVTPAAHYLCGGVYSDLSGNTNIRGLKVIGESACTGIHGANRLASTSLLECLVMGTAAANEDAEHLKKNRIQMPKIKPWRSSDESADMDLIEQDLILIKSTMWNYVGLVRTKKRLQRAQKILNELKIEVDEFYANSELSLPLLNLRAAVQSALLVVYAALMNPKSQGCHYLRDEQVPDT